jgi:hypothetical protein
MHDATLEGRNLKREKLWDIHTYELQQKQMKIQQEFRSYDNVY